MLITLLDIGGSNTRIAFKIIEENKKDKKEPENKKNIEYDYDFDYYLKFKTSEIKNIKEFLEKNFEIFKKSYENFNYNLYNSILLISFAGITEGKENFVLTNNKNFVLEKNFLEQFKQYFVLNDLESVAYRMKKIIEEKSFIEEEKNIDKEIIYKRTRINFNVLNYNFKIKNIFVVKPGTGLGSSLIFKSNIIPLELGFFPYSVFLEEDEEFKKFLEIKYYNKLNKIVTFEAFCSSKTLKYYYYFNYNKILEPEEITFEYENSISKKETINFFIKRLLYFSFIFSKSLNSNTIILSGNIVKAIKKEFFKEHNLKFLNFLKQIFSDKNIFIILEKDQNLKGLLDYYFNYKN